MKKNQRVSNFLKIQDERVELNKSLELQLTQITNDEEPNDVNGQYNFDDHTQIHVVYVCWSDAKNEN